MIFTIDVEDWAQSVLNRNNPVSARVDANTRRILDLLDEYNHKGTFFILGNVAEAHPQLIQSIVNAGHEIASHGYDHENIHNLTPEGVHREVERSVKILEDISGRKVIGFRAANFSIREDLFEWYCEALAKHKIRYDSSLFPMKVIKYGIEKEYSLKIFNEYHLREHYLSYIRLGKTKLPFFGGGYFRLSPYWLTKVLTKQLNPEHAVFYMHPYEIDTGEYAEVKRLYKTIPLKWQLTQFVQRKRVEPKLHRLFNDFEFTSFELAYYSSNMEEKSVIEKYNNIVNDNGRAKDMISA